MAGLITAASVARYSNQRARVLVVDRNPAAEPGKKTRNGWTCGDAVSRNSLNYLASFYQSAQQYSAKLPVGASYKGFDDTLASWTANRHMQQQCGQT